MFLQPISISGASSIHSSRGLPSRRALHRIRRLDWMA